MKINRIELENFRQFYGKQELVFATDPKKNVTLIHAENGYGKTTLLNAILWAFFNRTTAKFEQPEKILNFEAESEGLTFASVSVEFQTRNDTYIVNRNFSSRSDDTSFTAFKVGTNGALAPHPAPKTLIESIVPPEMAKYFFFDGESAEAFSSATNHQAVADAIRNILGVAIANTAVNDLKDIRKSVDKELGQLQGDEKLKAIEDELAKKIELLEQAVECKANFKSDIATFRSQRDQIVNELRGLEGSRLIQEQRDDKERDLSVLTTDIETAKEEAMRWVGERSTSLVSRKLTKETLDFVDEAKLKGRIPSPYNEDVVKDLLEAESCICGRDLKAGTDEWKAVAKLLLDAASAEVIDRALRARSRIRFLREQAAEAPASLQSIQNRLSKMVSKRAELEQVIEDLSQQIQNLPLEDIVAKERARRDLDFKIEKEVRKLGEMDAGIRKLEAEKLSLEKGLESASRSNKQARKLVTRRRLLESSVKFLEELLKQYETQARAKIESQVNDILDRVAHREYKCRINSDFSIELIYVGRSTPKSSGENQLLSLVFIASLVKFAAERADDEDLILKPGTIAPLVLDSPFGQLDESYRESTASWMPNLVEQLVLLVSTTQGTEEVVSTLAESIGAEYMLVAENTTPRNERKPTILYRHGEEHTTALYSQARAMTRIVKLN
jgi:DNA sulfur modification protein DndD